MTQLSRLLLDFKSDFKRSTMAVSIVTTLAFNLLASVAYTQTSKPESEKLGAPKPGPITIFDYRENESAKLTRFQYQPTPPEELRRFMPSKVRAMVVGVPPRKGLAGQTKQLFVDFPAEYLAFTTAVLINSTIHYENDPLFAYNFIEQNMSVAGAVSFAGFIGASRATQALMQSLRIAYDPARAPLGHTLETSTIRPGARVVKLPTGEVTIVRPAPYYDGLNTKVLAVPRPRPTLVQRTFAPLIAPLGLSAGLVASNIIHELWADPNLTICTKYTYLNYAQSSDPEITRKREIEGVEACDKFFETWMLSEKAHAYIPDILAMGAANLIEAYGIKKSLSVGIEKGVRAYARGKSVRLIEDEVTGRLYTKTVTEGAEKFVPVIIRGMRVAKWIAAPSGVGPMTRFLVTTGSIEVFLELVHGMSSFITKPLKEKFKAEALMSDMDNVLMEIDRTEKNKWHWKPRPDTDFCLDANQALKISSMTGAHYACTVPDQPSPTILLREMARRQSAWRQFILEDAYLAHQNWQTYVQGVGTMYANATGFYKQLLSLINYHRTDEQAKIEPSLLHVATPFYGLYTDATEDDDDIANSKVVETAEWLETYIESLRLRASKTGPRISTREAEELPRILNGLKAHNPAVPFKSLNSIEASFRVLEKMPEAKRIVFEKRVRLRMLSSAIERLLWILNNDPVYSDKHLALNSPHYADMARSNPFMQLRLRLGDPEPLGAGLLYLRLANEDPSVIAPGSKQDHPIQIGRVRTNTMAEYLAVSMVCGPEIDPRLTNARKDEIYRDKYFKEHTLLTRFDRFIEKLTGVKIHIDPAYDKNDVLVAVNEYINKETGLDTSWIHTFKPNALVTFSKGFMYNFRPPRIVDGVPRDICDKTPQGSENKTALISPHDTKWTIDGREYTGILDIIRERARPEIVGDSMPTSGQTNPFELWWTKNVNKHIDPLFEQFRTEYADILKEKYLPALTSKDLKIFNNSKTKTDRIIKLGALESLYDEANLYLLLIGKTSRVTTTRAVFEEYGAIATAVYSDYQQLGRLATDLSAVQLKPAEAKAKFESKKVLLEQNLLRLQVFIENRQRATRATGDVININEQTVKNLKALEGELASYWGIVRSLESVTK